MRRTSLFEDKYLESKIYKYPIHEILENNDIITNLKDNELKFYFVLDRYVYENVNTETNESQILFDSEYYLKKYDLTFSRDDIQYIQEFALRTFSFHTLILGELVPFIAIGITKHTKFWFRQLTLTSIDDFQLLRLGKWKYLENDLKILEQNIKPNSSLQKSLIWFTLAKLSNTRIEKFMNYYRCLEEFTRNFVESKRSTSEDLKKFLQSNYVDYRIISRVQDFRNKKIAHGNDYSLEFNNNFRKTIDEVEIITKQIINQEIKKLKFEGLKNPDFLYYYCITFDPSQRKIVLHDDYYPPHYFEKKLRINDNDLIVTDWLGSVTEKELPSLIMLNKFEHITIDGKLCKELIENFGKIIDY